MNIPRIINYLKENKIITEDSISSDKLSDVLLVSESDLIHFLDKSTPRIIRSSEIHHLMSCRLFDLAYELLNKDIIIPLKPKDYGLMITVQIDHDIIDDDLDLGRVGIVPSFIDWEHSIEEHNIKLTKEGLNEVFEKIPTAKYYPNLRFSIKK